MPTPPTPPTHLLARTGAPGARLRETAADLAAPLTAPVDAHRRLRGPYTAAGSLLRALLPDLLTQCPDLVRAHAAEIGAAAPELRGAAGPEDGAGAARRPTHAIAHALADLVRDYGRSRGGPASLVVDRVDQADPTDREFLAVLLARADPAELTLVLGAGGAVAPPGPLRAALDRHCRETPCVAEVADLTGSDQDLARRHVEDACTGPSAWLRAAYERIPEARRCALHDRRADELEALGEQTLRLGAVPFHRERGSDPAAAVRALRHALDHCAGLGFHAAAADLARRGLALAAAESAADAEDRAAFAAVLAATREARTERQGSDTRPAPARLRSR